MYIYEINRQSLKPLLIRDIFYVYLSAALENKFSISLSE